MKIVGLTGGIGSGKTTVAKMFEALGVPVYIADIEAKKLLNTSKVLKRKLIALFGNEAYNENGLNRAFIASKVFKNSSLLNSMNAIVHPAVAKHFLKWLKKQNSAYVIKEAAIIFEHQNESNYDLIITVTANINERIKRIIKRDNTTLTHIQSIMSHQLTDDEKIKKSNYVIVNDNLSDTKLQVEKLHKKILQSK